MSCRQVLPSGSRERYRSMMPAVSSVPTSSSSESLFSVMKPESFMMRSNCSVASKNLPAVSLSISLGTMCPRQSVEKLLSRRLRSLVVLVR